MRHLFLSIVVCVSLFFSGCGPSGPVDYTYLVAKRIDEKPGLTITLTIIRRFEKAHFCESSSRMYTKEGEYTAECLDDGTEFEPMFERKAVGKWYIYQRVGRFSGTIIMYDFNPPLPEQVLVQQLKQIAPHGVKFAAIHHAPAEVSIISPEGKPL